MNGPESILDDDDDDRQLAELMDLQWLAEDEEYLTWLDSVEESMGERE